MSDKCPKCGTKCIKSYEWDGVRDKGSHFHWKCGSRGFIPLPESVPIVSTTSVDETQTSFGTRMIQLSMQMLSMSEKCVLNQLAAAKTELEKYRWIPVEEGLPKDVEEKVLFLTTGHFVFEATTNEERFNCMEELNSSITHWMLTPTLPERKKGLNNEKAK